jgi:hypothetical protein
MDKTNKTKENTFLVGVTNPVTTHSCDRKLSCDIAQLVILKQKLPTFIILGP